MVSKIVAGLSVVLALGLAQPVLAQSAGGSISGGIQNDEGGSGGAMQGGAGGSMQSGGSMQGDAMQGGSGSMSGSENGGVSASINLSTEQKTKVIQDFTSVQTSPAEVNFDVAVGTAVPDTVTLAPVPPTVIEIVPQYEGYEFFTLADGRIVVVDPDTHKIVAILTA